MRITHCLLIVLLALLIALLWGAFSQQNLLLDSRRMPEERLDELLSQSRQHGKRLATLARQSSLLTSRTQAILERIAPSHAPGLIPAAAPSSSLTPYHGPDEPLVLYEAEPVKPAVKGGRQ